MKISGLQTKSEEDLMIYLDNAATTKIAPQVLDAMLPYLKDEYGNAGSTHKLGRQAADAVIKARKQVADLINASPEQIIFTSGGSESNSLVFQGLVKYLKEVQKKRILISATEHKSVIKSAKHAQYQLANFNSDTEECKKNYSLQTIPVDGEGHVILTELENILSSYDDIGVVSVMFTNNETGTVNPITKIASMCHKYGALFHTDCVQAAGVQQIDVKNIDCDFLTISSHKIHGNKGVGALYAKDTSKVTPIIHGGDRQEFGLRAGTENVASIVGFGKACELVKLRAKEDGETLSYFKRLFYYLLRKELFEKGLGDIIKINGESINKPGKIINILFKGIDGETLLFLLDAKGICVSSGAACNSINVETNHVLTAMGLDAEMAMNSIRISFSIYNTISEIEIAASTIAQCVYELNYSTI